LNTTIQQTIVQALQNGNWVAFFIVFWSGALLSLSSCTLVRIPIVIGYVGGASTSKKRAILLTLSFALALVISYTFLGVLFGIVSSLMGNMIRWSRYFYYLIGALALIIGVHMAGLVDFSLFPSHEHELPRPMKGGLLGAFLFGLVFAIFEAPICPCCGPVLFIIAGLTFAKGKILYAVLIFLTYAIGQSFPIVLIGSFTGIVKYISPKIEKIEGAVGLIGGNILIALALYFFLAG
jgi:cytochrome c-type biogenesis protein